MSRESAAHLLPRFPAAPGMKRGRRRSAGSELSMRVADKIIACGVAAAPPLTLAGAAAAHTGAENRLRPGRTRPPPIGPRGGPASPGRSARRPEPERTTADLWCTGSCAATHPGAAAAERESRTPDKSRRCRARLSMSRVAIPLPPKGEPPKLFVQLPINVSFGALLKITADAKQCGISTPFRRCSSGPDASPNIQLKDDLSKSSAPRPQQHRVQGRGR